MRRFATWCTACLCTLLSCAVDAPDGGEYIASPTSLRLEPTLRWLFYANSDLRQTHGYSSLRVIDTAKVESLLKDGLPESCRALGTLATKRCDVVALAQSEEIRVSSGATGLDIDVGANQDLRSVRLLGVTRAEPTMFAIDVELDRDGGVSWSCRTDSDGRCAAPSVITLAEQPARVVVDRSFRYAYVPHLTGRRLSLLDLDGPEGVALAQQAEEFFAEDNVHGTELGGGFDVAQMPCAVGSFSPAGTQSCRRPMLVASQRFRTGARAFFVGAGRSTVLPGQEIAIDAIDRTHALPFPAMGGLRVVELWDKPVLLVVLSNPAVLIAVDLTLEHASNPRYEVLYTLPICRGADELRILDDGESHFAAIACTEAAKVAFVDLTTFEILREVAVGDGASGMEVDVRRRWLWVANAREHSISLISWERRDAHFLRERLVIADESTAITRP